MVAGWLMRAVWHEPSVLVDAWSWLLCFSRSFYTRWLLFDNVAERHMFISEVI